MAIHLVAKRYFPVVVLLVAAIAYFQARGSRWLLGSKLDLRSAGSAPPAQGESEKALSEPEIGRESLARNPCNSPLGSLTTTSGDAVRLGDTSDPLSWPDCEGVQVLIVTESKDPWWSMTTLREPGEGRARLRRVGDSVAGKRVAFIGFNPRHQAPAVWLEGQSTFCQSTLFRKPTELVQAAPAAAAGRAPSLAHARQDVSEPAPGLLRSVRVVPEQRDGKVIGLRLFGIPPSSLLGSLGLKNGDRLESINGFNVASPEKALEAYARLRTASRLHVRLTRVGKLVDLNLNIN